MHLIGFKDIFILSLKAKGLNEIAVPEYRFCKRRFRFDYAFPKMRIAIELEGLRYGGKSRHQTIKGYAIDCEKYNLAGMMGWIVFRFAQSNIKKNQHLKVLDMIAKRRKEKGDQDDG